MGRFHGASQRAIAAELAAGLLTVQDGLPDTRAANDFVTEMPCDALRSVAPYDNFLLHINDTRRLKGFPGCCDKRRTRQRRTCSWISATVVHRQEFTDTSAA